MNNRVTATGIALALTLACGGSVFEVAAGAGAGGAPSASGYSGATSGGTVGDASGGESNGPGGDAGEAGAPSAGGAGTAGSATGGTGGAVAGGGSAGMVVGGVGGGGGSGGVLACLDVQASDQNCGACGYACVHGRHCTAGRCSPAWQALSIDNAPAARTRHAAGFVGTKYVVLGGALTDQGKGIAASAAYDLNSNAWSDLAPLNNARCSHQAVTVAGVIFTFGGLTDCSNGASTGPGLESFNPALGSGWSTISVSGEPAPRYNFAALWTGMSMLVYGGAANGQPAVSSGGLFKPSAGGPVWSDASCTLDGCQRGGYFSMFRDGDFVRVWGGGPFGSAPAGLAYNLMGQSWSAWTVPAGTADHLAQRFADDGRRIYFLTSTNLVSIYDRNSSNWLANDTAAMPSGFCTEGATAWTGSELVAWSGSCGAAPVNVGGRYQPPAPN